MKKALCAVLALLLVFCCLPTAYATETQLSFRSDSTFRILHLTDTQDDAYPAWDMQNLLREAIAFSDPDLIVFTGDIVEDRRIGDIGVDAFPLLEGVNVKTVKGELDLAKTRANVEKAVDAVFSAIEEFDIPYVIALGNNDRKVGLSSADWLEIFSKYPHCIVFDESGDQQDGIDYHVTVKGSDGADKFNVWLMDTGLKGISDEQIDWYRGASQAITQANGGEPIPAFAFQHIQAADIGNLFEPCKITDAGARKTGKGFVRLKSETAGGYNFYGYEPDVTTYEFEAWKACGDVIGAFFGHQHVEGFSGVWDGIELGFTYGCEMAKTGPYGFRVFTLHEDDIYNYDNTLYRYLGKVKLGNVRIASEETFTGPEAREKPLSAMLLRLQDLMLTIVSMATSLFR
ncbi:MAG: metallophosphoesterase [Clostridia bacterium]|nr:metallophosphoesterase [Clostridia bacterium]